MVIAKFLLTIQFVLAATMSMPDGFEKGRHVEMTVLSSKRAQRLFDEFVSHHEIPFGYPVDGCFARATAMARIAEDEKIILGKVWAHGRLRVISPNPRIGKFTLNYHVAPTAFVKGNDGKAVLMVFDPSLFKTPVPLEEWLNIMKTPGWLSPRIDKVYFGERFQYWPRTIEKTKKYSWQSADLRKMEIAFERYRRYEVNLRPENSLLNKVKRLFKSQGVQ